MKKIKIFIMVGIALLGGCSDQLDIQNPNSPTPASAKTPRGIVAFAQGGVYVNGFYELKFVDGVPGRFWTGAIGLHEIMGDVIGVEAANIYLNQIGCPDEVVLDNGTTVKNPQSPNQQKNLIREVNQNANQGNNPLFYEWAYMYAMNSTMNQILTLVGDVPFINNGEERKNTLKAWAYFWKGFAYSRIGSMYYAGIINNAPAGTNGNYVSKEAILAEAEKNFAAAETLLNGLASSGAYKEVLGALIPDICQVGKGGVLTTSEWIRNINTLRARNILVNTTVAKMTAEQWNQIITLTANGVGPTDKIFTIRSNDNGDLMSASSGNIPAKTYGSTAQGGTYKVSLRLIQDFKPGDQRLTNNFKTTAAWIGNADRGTIFNTNYALLDGGNKIEGTVVMCNLASGAYELVVAGSYEENTLMRAEALINTSNIDAGLALIDQLRTSQGAGLAAVSGTGLSLAEAREELRRERRVALAFKGFAFYDARRWEVIKNGRPGSLVIDSKGVVNLNATIKYNFLDYWDVPDNELVYNPPSAGSAPVKNPG